MTDVFVVEDEPLAAEAHAAIVGRLPGFRCTGTAGTVTAAIEALTGPARVSADVVLLDLHLPDGNGLLLVGALRRAGVDAAVLAVTADRDLRAVSGAVGAGVADYLLKPFSQATLAQKLDRVVAASGQAPAALNQWRIDQAFTTLHGEQAGKGLHADTVDLVRRTLREHGASSAAELAQYAAVSRPTARRYLEHLVTAGEAVRTPRYGTPGRPEHEYRLRP